MPKKIITRAILFAVILAAVVLVLWLDNARRARAGGTVLLSNGKSVFIGQSKMELESKLKDDLRVLDNSYSYIGNSGVVEGVLFMTDNKVSAVRITSNSGNRHRVTNIGISTAKASIEKLNNKNLIQLNANERITGYKYTSNSTVGYFLTSPCVNNPKVTTMVISALGKESLVLPDTTRLGPCEGDI